MPQSQLYAPAITIRRDYAATYEVYTGPKSSKLKAPPRARERGGHLSTKAIQRLKCAIELLSDSAQTKRVWWSEAKRYVSFKINFITLTLPEEQRHDDRWCVRHLLTPFLRWWRDRNSRLLYVWKAEVTDTGRIHFHLTTNQFIHMHRLQRKWNSILRKAGYNAGTPEKEAPSTEVKAVKHVKDIAAYLCAYVAKKDVYTAKLKRFHRRWGRALKDLKSDVYELPEGYIAGLKRRVECQLWNASRELLAGPCRILYPEHAILEDLHRFAYNRERVKNLDRCIIYNLRGLDGRHVPGIKAAYRRHLDSICTG